MRDRLIFAGQFIFTALVAAFLVVPALLSISAGITVNYFRGIQSGLTLQWIAQVWELYAGTILLSFLVAFATLAITLVAGVPAAYALHVRRAPFADRRGDHHAAAGNSGARNCVGFVACLWRLWRFPSLLAFHSSRPRSLHHAVHGSVGDGCVCHHRHQDT